MLMHSITLTNISKGVTNIRPTNKSDTFYLTGNSYESFDGCKRAIDNAYDLIKLGLVSEDYIDDPEGPSMLAYDKNWLCPDDCDT